MKTKIVTSLLLSSLAWSNAQADVRIMGNETALINTIATEYKQNLSYHKDDSATKKRFAASDMLYVDVASVPSSDYRVIKNAVLAGQLVVLDLSGFINDEDRMAVTKELTGLGMSTPILVSGLVNGESILNAISGDDITDVNGKKIGDSRAKQQSITASLTHVLNRFKFGVKIDSKQAELNRIAASKRPLNRFDLGGK